MTLAAGAKLDPHPVFRLGVNHLAERGEGCAAARNPQRDLRPLRDWDSRNRIASEQTQIAGECGEKPFRAHVGDFDAGCERIPAGAVESRRNGPRPRCCDSMPSALLAQRKSPGQPPQPDCVLGRR